MKAGPRHQYFLSLLLPQLHLALLRQAEPSSAATVRRPRDAGAGAPATRRALSAREREVVHWLQEGKSNADIAAILGLSPLTVKNHLQRIYQLLGARNRTEAVHRCAALRLLPQQREATGKGHFPA
jgi:DNA-binding CsgD family transcriptional regulator